ncbi:MAG: hemerythrin domain-containing protein [Smithella sp.]
MKYASEDLINEHEEILSGLEILKKASEPVRTNKEAPLKDLIEIVQFLRLFVDKCHHGKEEELLFPAMEKAGIPKENGPIGQMLLEHEQGRQYMEAIDKTITEKGILQEAFIKNADEYIYLLRNHIEKENVILFPMGDKLIPQERQAKLLEEFEAYEQQVMGLNTHQKLHDMLHKLKEKYLEEQE